MNIKLTKPQEILLADIYKSYGKYTDEVSTRAASNLIKKGLIDILPNKSLYVITPKGLEAIKSLESG